MADVLLDQKLAARFLRLSVRTLVGKRISISAGSIALRSYKARVSPAVRFADGGPHYLFLLQ